MPQDDFIQEGIADLNARWQFTPKQLELCNATAPNRLAIGGIRSGKTAGAIMYGVMHFLLPFPGCAAIAMRRTMPELKEGAIADFQTHVPKELYSFVSNPIPTATFFNGSKMVFRMCANPHKDVQKMLGTAYPYILIDECSQFSGESWDYITTRNTANPECKPNPNAPCGGCGDPTKCGYECMPYPQAWGCTNPIGEHFDFYKTTFFEKRPYDPPEGSKQDRDGLWWVKEAGVWRCVYDPANYAMVHSTVLDNPHELRRDPGIVDRLKSKPKALMMQMLYGSMDVNVEAYFNCFDHAAHVVDIRDKEHGEPIVWEPWQPVWCGWDWGYSHWTSVYAFTKAQVLCVDGEYRRKTVCIAECVQRRKTGREMCAILATTFKKHPGIPLCESCMRDRKDECPHRTLIPQLTYFSWEQFGRKSAISEHSPTDELNKELRSIGWPPLSIAEGGHPARIGGATLILQLLKHGQLVVLDTCKEIIRALPQLMRDPDDLEDVLKPDGASKADDVYDGFRYGVYGYLNPRNKSETAKKLDRLNAIEDPFTKKLEIYKATREEAKKREPNFGSKGPSWMNEGLR